VKTAILTLSTDALSVSGLPLVEEYQFIFTTITDLIRPEILSIESASIDDYSTLTLSGYIPVVNDPLHEDPDSLIPKMNAIAVTFSEPMDPDVTGNAFKLTPAVSGRFYHDQSQPDQFRLIFQPDSPGFQQNTVYHLAIDRKAADLSGNTLDEGSSDYTFSILETPPVIEQVFFNDDSDPNRITAGTDGDPQVIENINTVIENIKINVVDPLTDTKGILYLSIRFDDTDHLDFSSLYPSVSVSRISGSGSYSPFISSMTPLSPDRFNLVIRNLEANESLATYIPNLYKITVKGGSGGVSDQDGCYLEKDLTLYFRVNGRF
jgi:hypothetical protein